MTAPWLAALRRAAPPVAHDLPTWWAWHRKVRAHGPVARAALASARADRLSSAFTSGYQAALASLLGTGDEPLLGALAVTEAAGGHPRAIATTLADGRLNGTKTFVTGGAQAEVVWVVARDAAASRPDRPALKIVRLPTTAPGIRWSAGPTPPFVPEVAHGVLTLTDTPAEHVLDRDGYAEVVKPFRTVEDLHVLAAVLGYALGEAARQHHPDPAWTEDALALLVTVEALAGRPPDHTAVHLALAAVYRQARPLLDRGPWRGEAAQRWSRDAPLLQVAAAVRSRRTERAWQAWQG